MAHDETWSSDAKSKSHGRSIAELADAVTKDEAGQWELVVSPDEFFEIITVGSDTARPAGTGERWTHEMRCALAERHAEFAHFVAPPNVDVVVAYGEGGS